MKNVFNPSNIGFAGQLLAQHYDEFDRAEFLRIALDSLEQRELKDRANQIFLALKQTLPKDFLKAQAILLNTLKPVKDNQEIGGIDTDESGVAGWMILPFSQYVGELGGEYLKASMAALREMTKRFSSEFGIRFVFLTHGDDALAIARQWVDDPCHHVRRLVSEGCRPLLPWAMQLPEYKNHPEKILPLLEPLRFDSSEYVRRSVANNLNDIAKHHPEFVVKVIGKWLAESEAMSLERQKNTSKLAKHACRTLIKSAHPNALALFGFADSSDINAELIVTPARLIFGESLTMQVNISNPTPSPIKILLDFVVHHQKANGKTTEKVFKWGEYKLVENETKLLEKSHAIKPISTRKYYPGIHKVELQVNGRRLAPTEFELVFSDEA